MIQLKPGREMGMLFRGWFSEYICPSCGNIGMDGEDTGVNQESVQCKKCDKRFTLNFKDRVIGG